MEEEKHKRIVAATTVTAILLAIIIVIVLISQVIQISAMNNRKKVLLNELHEIQRKYEDAEDILDRLQNDDDFLRILQELGKLGEDTSQYYPE